MVSIISILTIGVGNGGPNDRVVWMPGRPPLPTARWPTSHGCRMRHSRFDGATDPGDDTSGMTASSPKRPPSMPSGLTPRKSRSGWRSPRRRTSARTMSWSGCPGRLRSRPARRRPPRAGGRVTMGDPRRAPIIRGNGLRSPPGPRASFDMFQRAAVVLTSGRLGCCSAYRPGGFGTDRRWVPRATTATNPTPRRIKCSRIGTGGGPFRVPGPVSAWGSRRSAALIAALRGARTPPSRDA